MKGKLSVDDFPTAGLAEELAQQVRTSLGHLQPVEANDLLARDYPDSPAIVGGGVLTKQGLAVKAGPPKRGKSASTMQLAVARALGWPWLGFQTSPGRSAVIQAEIPEPELQARLRLMTSTLAAPIPRGMLHFVTRRGLWLDRPDGLRTCRTLIETLEPDLVVFDPLARFMSGDENSTRDMGRLIAAVDELIQAYSVAVFIVHHTSKPSSDDPRDGGHRLRGSSALFAAADSVLILDRTKEGDRFKLSFELRHGREPAPMLLRRTEHLWLEPAGPSETLLRVAAIVERLPLRYSQLVAAIQADLDTGERTAQALLARAKSAGLIAVEAGVYRTTASDRKGGAAVGGNWP